PARRQHVRNVGCAGRGSDPRGRTGARARDPGRRMTDEPDAAPGEAADRTDRALPDKPSVFIKLTDWFGRTMVSGLAHVRIEGLDHARGLTGPVIVASNHASNLDGILVACWITPALG